MSRTFRDCTLDNATRLTFQGTKVLKQWTLKLILWAMFDVKKNNWMSCKLGVDLLSMNRTVGISLHVPSWNDAHVAISQTRVAFSLLQPSLYVGRRGGNTRIHRSPKSQVHYYSRRSFLKYVCSHYSWRTKAIGWTTAAITCTHTLNNLITRRVYRSQVIDSRRSCISHACMLACLRLYLFLRRVRESFSLF